MSSESAVDRMNSYKGASTPAPLIPLTGLVLGISLPYMLANHVFDFDENLPPVEAVLVCLKSFSAISLLFLMEFILGASARSTSPKASFSPAAAIVSGVAPFCVVQANRIHQNHIENLLILAPTVLAAAAAGASANWLVSIVVSWVLSRIVYRIGYCSTNPFWRLCGSAASLSLYFIAASLFVVKL